MRLRPRIVLGRAGNDGSLSFQYLVTRPPVTILACFSILYLFLVQYLRQANYRDPTSYFFDPARAYERIYSTDRIEQADAFIQSAKLQSAGPEPSQQPPVVCIGVVTVKRREDQYVRRTIGSLLEGLPNEERRSIYLNILVGHAEPSEHPISGEKWIETLPDKVLEYRKTDIARIQQWEEGGWYRNKTIFDYTYLLNDCYATGARYIAMIEDDTLAVEGWYPRVLEALKDIEKEMERRAGVEWVFLRLFYTEELFGWNSENWPIYVFWSFMSWAIITSSLIAVRSRLRSMQAFLSNAAILTISGVCIPALGAFFFASGRNSIWPLTPGIHEMNKFGCCSQGYVYPRDIVAPLLQRTNLETDWLVDMMIEDIADDEGWVRWARTPALLQHIGTSSPKGHGFDETAGQLWNFGFELYEKLRLGRS
ncbi:uncharacterized protein BP5553_00053 [Venustampulla echinocandica]|uniref:Integral membrane protein n=1 Tax=Venustampulla echinocandica TaxID=2656787 RepID=A0A370TX14_9HELO|nr:uncharacterized protein BP5553_00053 [Venustampulla echinocandica]RDL40074.1 hypothetical protein BP5553_00053 [Venustampulla echinocandica]